MNLGIFHIRIGDQFEKGLECLSNRKVAVSCLTLKTELPIALVQQVHVSFEVSEIHLGSSESFNTRYYNYLLQHYGKKSVMTVAIPVAVKALQSGNKDLIRNTSSYLSLAAIHNGRLLAQYSLQIISSITSG